jgi:hypothetical protein
MLSNTSSLRFDARNKSNTHWSLMRDVFIMAQIDSAQPAGGVPGVSGSCKSSLAFDTIFAEGQRRYLESFSAYARQF